MPLTAVIIKIHLVLLFTLHNTKNIAYHITEELIFYADKLMMMGNSKKICVYLILRFYSNHENLMLAKYTCTCFTVCLPEDNFHRKFIFAIPVILRGYGSSSYVKVVWPRSRSRRGGAKKIADVCSRIGQLWLAIFIGTHQMASWCHGRASDSQSRGRGFESQPAL